MRSGVDDDTGIDFDACYTVTSYPGIAFYLAGYQTEWTEGGYDTSDPDAVYFDEPEEIERKDMVRAIMVGDDFVHIVNVEDLTVIDPDDVCSCGQIGCWCVNNTSG